jgi:hypothetical protein
MGNSGGCGFREGLAWASDRIFSGSNPGAIQARIGVLRTSESGSSGNSVDARKENRFNRIFFEKSCFNPFDFMQNSVDLRVPLFGIDSSINPGEDRPPMRVYGARISPTEKSGE